MWPMVGMTRSAGVATRPLKATAGGRYYDYKENRTFRSGGLFANGDNNTDTTASSGFSPRFLLSYQAARRDVLNRDGGDSSGG